MPVWGEQTNWTGKVARKDKYFPFHLFSIHKITQDFHWDMQTPEKHHYLLMLRLSGARIQERRDTWALDLTVVWQRAFECGSAVILALLLAAWPDSLSQSCLQALKCCVLWLHLQHPPLFPVQRLYTARGWVFHWYILKILDPCALCLLGNKEKEWYVSLTPNEGVLRCLWDTVTNQDARNDWKRQGSPYVMAKLICLPLFWHESKACVILNYFVSCNPQDSAGRGCVAIVCSPSWEGSSSHSHSPGKVFVRMEDLSQQTSWETSAFRPPVPVFLNFWCHFF